MRTIAIPDDLYTELLEKALSLNYRNPVDVIRFLITDRLKGNLITKALIPTDNNHGNLITKGGVVPHGTKLRCTYKGRLFDAIVDNGAIVVEGKRCPSPSAAAIYVAKLQGTPNPSINGWGKWEYFDSSANRWNYLKSLRENLNLEDGILKSSISKSEEGILTCKGKNANARGKYSGDKFIVLKGSKANLEETPSQPQNIKRIRKRLLTEGILRRENDHLVFTHDYPFDSLSAAAGVVLGRSAYGKIEWWPC